MTPASPGPRVVALGGGHGLASTLCAARQFAGELTAVVSVADDGGSSGRLREQLGIAPPGDLRKCLGALASPASLLGKVFEHRFEADDIGGHPLGNLVIAGLVSATGDLQRALDEAGRLLGASGRVVPATAEPVVLKAEAETGEIEGQTAVQHTAHIRRVSLVPADPPAAPAALDALAEADLVVIGPGSLFTSVLAVLVVPALAEAVRRSPGRRVYVANLLPQAAETAGFDVADHVRALEAHGIEVDAVLADDTAIAVGAVGVPLTLERLGRDDGGPGHDPRRLAAALAGLVG